MIEVRFPGGVAVDVMTGGFVVRTDQPIASGGGGTAPSPFDLFVASIAACAGFYALRFCRERGLSTLGLSVTLATEEDEAHHRIAGVRLAVTLPDGFPEKYRGAILRAVNQCSVKRHLEEPPVFDVSVTPPTRALPPAREVSLLSA